MRIFVTGVNHKTTPLELREKLNFNMQQQKDALNYIKKLQGVSECILLSTCNRTEVYIYSDSESFEQTAVENALCELKDLSIYDFKKYFYNYSGKKTVKHLFKVASGLDSMVLGEDQILGQVKSAHELALEADASDVVLNTLFREAITAAKEIKTNTELSKNSLSIASLAVKLMEDAFGGSLRDKNIMVIGAGKIGSIVLRNLNAKEFGRIYATSRNHGRTSCDTRGFSGVTYINYNDRYLYMDECDIIISSTSSPHYTITRDILEKTLKSPKNRLFVDLAVPRDIDTAVKDLDGIRYFNIDDFESEACKNIGKRVVEAEKAGEIINEYVVEFERWYEYRKQLPVIREIQSYVDSLLEERISQTLARLKNAGEEEKETVKISMTNIANDILNKFVYSMRECGDSEDMKTYFRCLGNVVKSENNE